MGCSSAYVSYSRESANSQTGRRPGRCKVLSGSDKRVGERTRQSLVGPNCERVSFNRSGGFKTRAYCPPIRRPFLVKRLRLTLIGAGLLGWFSFGFAQTPNTD